MTRVLLTIVSVLAVLVVVTLVLLFTGAYDVSAMNRETSLTQWAFSTMMDRSVKRQAAEIAVPPLDDSTMIRIGFDHYSDMCVSCHGSPAGGRTEAGEGLNPPAPDLSNVANDWKPSELYWIIKNGVRMTGMPAFGPTHQEKELWGMVAFVRKLPGMTAEQYKAYAARAAAGEEESSEASGESHGIHAHH